MKIAIFSDVLLEIPGGIGSSITAAKKSLEAAGHEVLVFAPGWTQPKDQNIILVPTLKLFRPNGAPWARRPSLLATWIEQNYPEILGFDLFHAHYEGPTSIAAIALAKKYGKPLVQTLHGREDQALTCNIPRPPQSLIASLLLALHTTSLRHLGLKPETKLIFDPRLAPNKRRAKMWRIIVNEGNAADLVISPSEHFAQKLQKMGLKAPVKVLPNGIDDDIIPIAPEPRSWDGQSPLKILWNSRLSKEKRFLPFLEGLKIAGENGLNYELIAYGSGNDLKSARKYVKKHQMPVKFMGSASRPHILRTSTHCHLSVTASYDFDTHGLTIVEAEACGTPALICDPDLVTDLAPGSFILTKTPSAASIAEALQDLQSHPEKIHAMSTKMLSHRRAVYQSSRIAELLKIYQNVSSPR